MTTDKQAQARTHFDAARDNLIAAQRTFDADKTRANRKAYAAAIDAATIAEDKLFAAFGQFRKFG
jgi:hypothetical protein